MHEIKKMKKTYKELKKELEQTKIALSLARENEKNKSSNDSKYFIKTDNTVYIYKNLTTTLKMFEDFALISDKILEMNNNERMSISTFHKHLKTVLTEKFC